MTLREKFKKANETSWVRNESLLELIADEYAIQFAIGFGEYLDSLTTEDMGILSIKELLEIYKETL